MVKKPSEEFVPLSMSKAMELTGDLGNRWQIIDGKLVKDFEFKNPKEALLFVNEIEAIAEREKHHPEIDIETNKVHVSIITHSVNALTVADFILAERINEMSLL